MKRRGLGRMRHIQTRYLWIQERVGANHISISAVAGTKNPADILTKPGIRGPTLKAHLERLGYYTVERHAKHRSTSTLPAQDVGKQQEMKPSG